MKPSLTYHAKQRLAERTDYFEHFILNRLRSGNFLGLPRQTNNRRVALIDGGRDATVVIWTKTAHKIITVLTLSQYLERHGHLLHEGLRDKLRKRYLAV